MKKIFLSFAVLFLTTVSLFAQEKAVAPVASTTAQPAATAKSDELIKFKENIHDFGKIKQGVPVTFDFAFKNLSKKAVVIESATASCGCTTPVKPEKPIAKNKSDVVKAGFNAASPGPFEKTIYVKVAGAAQPTEIKIKGEVLTPEAYTKYEESKGKKTSK